MSPKTNKLADGLIERTSSMLDEIAVKTVHKDKESDRQGRKKQSEAKPVQNISKKPQSYLKISPM